MRVPQYNHSFVYHRNLCVRQSYYWWRLPAPTCFLIDLLTGFPLSLYETHGICCVVLYSGGSLVTEEVGMRLFLSVMNLLSRGLRRRRVSLWDVLLLLYSWEYNMQTSLSTSVLSCLESGGCADSIHLWRAANRQPGFRSSDTPRKDPYILMIPSQSQCDKWKSLGSYSQLSWCISISCRFFIFFEKTFNISKNRNR